MATKTVAELIKHFETFTSNYSVFGADELSNYETICRLKRLKRTRKFNVQNDENESHCILIWQTNEN